MLSMEECLSDAVSKFLTQLMLWLDSHDPSLTCLTCDESEVGRLSAYSKLQETGFAPITMSKRQLYSAIHDTLGHWLVVCIYLTQFSSVAHDSLKLGS
jgi:hypothetical protein